MSKKLEKLNKLMALMKDDTLTPKEVEKFLTFVLSAVKKNKDEIQNLSDKNMRVFKDTLQKVLGERKEMMKDLTANNDDHSRKLEVKIETLLAKVQETMDSIVVKDGKDADEELIVDKVLERLPEQEKFELKGDEIINVIESLPIEEKYQIDASRIKNLPRNNARANGGGWRNLYQQHDVDEESVFGATNGQALIKNETTGLWEAGTPSVSVAWGDITGTLTDQTDLVTYIADQVATADTLQEVTDNGATTTNNITIDGGGLVNSAININGSTDSAIRSTATDLLQLRHGGSTVLEFDGSGNATIDTRLDVDNLRLDGNTLSSVSGALNLTSNDAQNINIKPAGAGILELESGSGGISIATESGNSDITLSPHGTGSVIIDNIDINGNTISATNTDGDIELTPDGAGNIEVNTANGIEINPGSDINTTVFKVDVTDDTGALGLPALLWDENEDWFDATRAINETSLRTAQNSVEVGLGKKVNGIVQLTGNVTSSNYFANYSFLSITDNGNGYSITSNPSGFGQAANIGFATLAQTTNVDRISGTQGVVFLDAAGTSADEAYGVSAGIANVGATITDAHLFGGVVINPFGTITNLYGLKLPDITAGSSSNYAIKTGAGLVDFGDDTYIGGNLKVGDQAFWLGNQAGEYRIQRAADNSITWLNDGNLQIFKTYLDDNAVVVPSGDLGVGLGNTALPDAKLHIKDTGTQARFAYDASNFVDLDVNSSGNLTVTPSGGSATFQGDVTVNGSIDLDEIITSRSANAPLGFVVNDTDGKSAALSAGNANAVFLFDNTGGFAIQARSSANVLIGSGSISDNKLFLDNDGSLQLNEYGSGTNTGTEAYRLAVDSSGNVIETDTPMAERVVTTASDTTAVIDVEATDTYELSAMAADTTFSFTGTPVDGQKIIIRFKDDGTTRALTWTGFTVIGVTLPTTTTVSKWHYVGVQYNSAASQWHVLSVGEEA